MNEIQERTEEKNEAESERMGQGEIGCLVFVIVLVSTAVMLVMRMFIPEVGFWKAILCTVGFFAVIAVFAAGKILFSERVVAPLTGAPEKSNEKDKCGTLTARNLEPDSVRSVVGHATSDVNMEECPWCGGMVYRTSDDRCPRCGIRSF